MLKTQIIKSIFLALIWVSFSSFALGQKQVGNLETLINIDFDQTPVVNILNSITEQTGLGFSYSPSVVDVNKKVSCHLRQKSVRYVLNNLFGSEINVKQRGKYILLVKNNPNSQSDKVFIEGYITEPGTGKGLSEVTVYNKELKASAVTDKYGYFKIELIPIKPITELRVCKSGFSDTTINQPLKPGFVDIRLQAADTTNEISGLKKWIPSFPAWLVPRELLINAINIKTDSFFHKAQISVLPFIGTNQLLGGKTINDYSFNIFAGYTESVRKLEVGGWFNFVRHDAGVCQLAGFGNVVGGSTYGFQGAGFYNLSKENKGVQASGFFNVGVYDGGMCQLSGFGNFTWGTVHGVQIAGYFNIAKEVNGMQTAGFVNYAQKLRGVQLSGFSNFAGRGTGSQITGAVNISQSFSKNQLSGFLNVADTVDQTQIAGFLNVAKEVNGMQLSSFLNVAKRVDGAQISIINIADTCSGVSIGLISYVRKGYHRFEISADELINVNLSYKLGVSRFYNIFTVGISPGANKLATLGYGFGTLLGKGEKRKLNIELTQNFVDETKSIRFKNQIDRIYFGIDRQVSKRVSINYGLSLNVFQTEETDQTRIDQFEAHVPYTFLKPELTTKMWVGGRLGLRF